MDPQTLRTVLHYFLGGTLGAAGMVCIAWFMVESLNRRALRRSQDELIGRFERKEASIAWLASRVADSVLREEAGTPLLSEAKRTPVSLRAPH